MYILYLLMYLIKKNNCMIMMPCTKIVNFMAPGSDPKARSIWSFSENVFNL